MLNIRTLSDLLGIIDTTIRDDVCRLLLGHILKRCQHTQFTLAWKYQPGES